MTLMMSQKCILQLFSVWSSFLTRHCLLLVFPFSYSNIFVTSPSPDNLHTMFEFIFKGFDALQYEVELTPSP